MKLDPVSLEVVRNGLTSIAEEINNRPRRRLGYLTPTEAFARLLAGEPHVASTP